MFKRQDCAIIVAARDNSKGVEISGKRPENNFLLQWVMEPSLDDATGELDRKCGIGSFGSADFTPVSHASNFHNRHLASMPFPGGHRIPLYGMRGNPIHSVFSAGGLGRKFLL